MEHKRSISYGWNITLMKLKTSTYDVTKIYVFKSKLSNIFKRTLKLLYGFSSEIFYEK